MKEILNIISSIGSATPNINPTKIYNEGWMIRLLVYHSIKEGITFNNIDFKEGLNWTSEALISSPFIYKGQKKEGYTHADIMIGDFDINYSKSGKVDVKPNGSIFGIIEAKMKSDLSKGTKYAPNYNQASRNLACIAYNTQNSNIRTFFGVVAPESTIIKHNIKGKTNKQFILDQIIDRYKLSRLTGSMDKILKKAKTSNVFFASFEEWIKIFPAGNVKTELSAFYKECLKWNRIK